MPLYKELKTYIKGNIKKTPNNITVIGNDWGIACNSIHFIDLVSWLFETYPVNCNSNKLGKWKPF